MQLAILPLNPLYEIGIAAILLVYIMIVVQSTKYVYKTLMKRGLPKNVVIYYNRKIIHMMAGGVVALLVPYIFTSPLIPLVFALTLAILNYIPHKNGKLMYWYQVPENMYEVNFCIAWGIMLTVLWLITDSPFIAILPPLFISFGDAITGIVRNAIFKRRTKHWVGNIAMAIVVITLGFIYAGYSGAIAGAIASIVERLEFNPIDDNILISVFSSLTLIILKALGW